MNPLLAVRESFCGQGSDCCRRKADSPAEAAGLREGDIIIRFGGKEISNIADLVQAIRTSEIGEEVEIVFVRGEDTKTTSARLVERPTS